MVVPKLETPRSVAEEKPTSAQKPKIDRQRSSHFLILPDGRRIKKRILAQKILERLPLDTTYDGFIKELKKKYGQDAHVGKSCHQEFSSRLKLKAGWTLKGGHWIKPAEKPAEASSNNGIVSRIHEPEIVIPAPRPTVNENIVAAIKAAKQLVQLAGDPEMAIEIIRTMRE